MFWQSPFFSPTHSLLLLVLCSKLYVCAWALIYILKAQYYGLVFLCNVEKCWCWCDVTNIIFFLSPEMQTIFHAIFFFFFCRLEKSLVWSSGSPIKFSQKSEFTEHKMDWTCLLRLFNHEVFQMVYVRTRVKVTPTEIGTYWAEKLTCHGNMVNKRCKLK